MRSLHFPLAVAAASALLLISSCKKDPALPTPAEEPLQVVKLTVKPLWNGAPFNKDSVYAAAGAQRIKTSLVKFYLADLDLIATGKVQRLFDADLFDVTNGPVQRVLHAPAGNYAALHMGLGLPYALNHRDLSTIPPDAPTGNNSGMYWTWATMYRFVLFEGRFDSDPNGVGIPPYTFSLHTGGDTCYRERTVTLPLVVTMDDTTRLTITVDIARFFTDGDQVLDLSEGAVWHGEPEGLPLGLKVADLESAALGAQVE